MGPLERDVITFFLDLLFIISFLQLTYMLKMLLLELFLSLLETYFSCVAHELSDRLLCHFAAQRYQ